MKRNGIISSIKNLIETIKPMPMKEKANHILTSYTDVVFLLAVVLALLLLTVSSLLFPGTKNILGGAVFNVQISSEGTACITNDFAQTVELEVTNKEATVDQYSFQYVEVSGDNFETMGDMQNALNYMDVMEEAAMSVAAQELDFLMADRESMKSLNNQEFCVDLSQFLTEDMLTQIKDILVYMETGEDCVLAPVAIDISGTAFAKTFISSQNTCVAFVANTTRPDNCRSFLEYILNWSEETNN